MIAWVLLTWKTLGGGEGRTSLVAEDSIPLPPGPSTDGESLPRTPSPTLSSWRETLLAEKGGHC